MITPIRSTGIFTFTSGLSISIPLVIASCLFESTTALVLVLIGLSLFIFFSALSVHFDIRHPFTWFNGVFWLYSIGSPLLFLLSTEVGSRMYETSSLLQAVFLHYIGIVSFSIAVGIKTHGSHGDILISTSCIQVIWPAGEALWIPL